MAGYNGFSMSNNAVEAYYNGEKPLSKWKKADIIEAIENAIKDGNLTLNCNMEKLKKLPVKILKKLCLYYSSWHHTSNHYNKTDFYSLDIDTVAELTDEKLTMKLQKVKQKRKQNQKKKNGNVLFLNGKELVNILKQQKLLKLES